MHRTSLTFRALGALLLLAGATTAVAATDPERQSLDELRNTVVNLLQGLVDRGVLTREQAEKMVRDAQSKAQADAAAVVAQEKAEEDAVRVPYVPQIVKDEIRRQVATDLGAQVTKEVMQSAQSQGWGVPGALPDWVRRMRWSGDVRMRGQGDFFASDNAPSSYLDFQRVNDAGGIGKAGTSALANTTEDRQRLRARLRFGFDTNLGYGWTTGMRLATGSLRDPVSTNQTLGTYGFRDQISMDLAWIDWQSATQRGTHRFDLTIGRMRDPFFTASDLVYDQDLTFDGIALGYRYSLFKSDLAERTIVATAGAFPLQEVELSKRDKWLLGGQLGLDWKHLYGSRTKIAVGFYDFENISGRMNSFQSNLLDYTAPQFLSRGNTVFDIRNDNDSSTNLYALAADYSLLNVSLSHDWHLDTQRHIVLAADYVRNVGYDGKEVLARTGSYVSRRDAGYQAELGVGSLVMTQAGSWRASVGYRYVERDAVLDAFTDSDFRLGGTDAKGYYFGLDYSFTPMVTGRLKYLSGNEIDGPPLSVSVLQLDLTASF